MGQLVCGIYGCARSWLRVQKNLVNGLGWYAASHFVFIVAMSLKKILDDVESAGIVAGHFWG